MSRTGGDLWSIDFADAVPFVGIGEIQRMHLNPHEFLNGRTAGVEFGKTPWSETSANLVTIERDGTAIAVLSVEGDCKLNIESLQGKLHDTILQGPQYGYGTYTIDITPTMTPTQIGEQIGLEKYVLEFQGNPEIFSMVPLEVKFNMITEGSLNEVPAIVGNRLLMDGRLSKISNGVINVPAGQVTNLGPLLNAMINRRQESETTKEAYMVTRRLTLSIRMLSYGG